LESSGHPYDTDDEDFISSGSGLPPPFDEVEDTTVYTIAPGV
uniref:Polyprotein n=1 Tax=Heligmosomoides polygyrus TaxID=6339 RepID=A0A183F951_HELPZ